MIVVVVVVVVVFAVVVVVVVVVDVVVDVVVVDDSFAYAVITAIVNERIICLSSLPLVSRLLIEKGHRKARVYILSCVLVSL